MDHDAGREHFLEGLYRLHHKSLCAFVRRKYGPGPPDPEDVVQAAFLRLASNADRTEIPNPEAYLKLAVRNAVIDAHRRSETQSATLQKVRIAEGENSESSAEDVYSSRQELERLATIVAGLKPKQRAAFLMNRVDGLTYAEIARRMRISPAGARLLVLEALDICSRKMGDRS
jgi:RNA polymerase sigma-70 factor (ECF subfamily)